MIHPSSSIARILFLSLSLATVRPTGVHAEPTPAVPPQDVSLPSAEPSGEPANDRIWFTFYPAAPPAPNPAPAVILLHPLGEQTLRMPNRFARYLAKRGIAGAVMTLPYHMRRRPPNEGSGRRFTDPDVDRMAQASRQSASDVSTVVTWLAQQPSVDSRRIGVVGISLGATIAHLAMGRDERLSAGVAILGGGNLEDLRRTSLVFTLRNDSRPDRLSPEESERLRQVDPITYADRNRPRRVLMIQAARDLLMPPRNARALWEALGRPPIRWVDTNHFGIGLAAREVMRASADYLRTIWSTDPPGSPPAPPLPHVPAVKLGFLMELNATIVPTVAWQVLSFGRRSDHMSALHLDLGWGGRGLYAGLALTLNAFLDIGLAHRFDGATLRPYASLHVVF